MTFLIKQIILSSYKINIEWEHGINQLFNPNLRSENGIFNIKKLIHLFVSYKKNYKSIWIF
jgi:hypothetical protein